MTDAANPKTLKPELQSWLEAWKTCTQNLLSQVSGQPYSLEMVDTPLPSADSDMRYTIATAGALQAELALRLSQSSGIHLARMFLGGEPAVPLAAAPEA